MYNVNARLSQRSIERLLLNKAIRGWFLLEFILLYEA